MRENIERVLELGLALSLISMALGSFYSLSHSVGSMIERSYEGRRPQSFEFSPLAKSATTHNSEFSHTETLDQYFIASEFRRLTELESEEQYAFVDGIKISLSMEDLSPGIENDRGDKLKSEDLASILSNTENEALRFRFKNSKINKTILK